MEKLCCFCDLGSSFLRVFPKMQQNFCDSAWYMNWNKRVGSERRKSHFWGPRFQNFAGEDTPGSPYNCEVLCICISHLRSWIRPWLQPKHRRMTIFLTEIFLHTNIMSLICKLLYVFLPIYWLQTQRIMHVYIYIYIYISCVIVHSVIC
jgi:hypothetical protein